MRLALVLLLPACVHVHLGSGVPDELVVSAEGVSRFTSAVPIDTRVRVDPGAAPELRVSCDTNLLHLFTTEIDGESLTLGTPKGTVLHPETECAAVLVVGALTEARATGAGGVSVGTVQAAALDLVASGSGDLTVDGLAVEQLDVTASGSGDVLLAGSAAGAWILVSGSGDVGDAQLVAEAAEVTATGSGDVSLTVTERLDATLTGSGDLFVFGAPPEREVTETGSGEVSFE